MKKLIIALLLIGTASFGQQQVEKHGARDQAEKMTPEQRNQLHLKKMTLDLGLNESQQREMGKIIAEQSAKRQAWMEERKANREKGIKLTAEQRFARENQMLDDKIATKARVKKILNSEQFDKWERQNEKRSARKNKMHKKGEQKVKRGNEQK
jgi:hypothetical protein